MGWKENPGVEWSTDGGSTWIKVTDHGRAPISIDIERVENKQQMVNGSKRRYVVAKKRNFSLSWENLPNVVTTFLANGTTSGVWLEEFYNSTDGAFKMRLRTGAELNTTNPARVGTINDSDNERIFNVIFADFSKEVVKRGPAFDLWSLSISLEEV